MLEWMVEIKLERNTYQERKRAIRKLATRARMELRPGAQCAVRMVQGEDKIGLVWHSAYVPDEVGSVKTPRWDHFSGTYRCGNVTL